MRIDFASLAFGYQVRSGGNTPNWATALGQGKEHKINDSKYIDEIIKGMIYSGVPVNCVKTKIGRGGTLVSGSESDGQIALAAVFDKVFINDTLIKGGKYVLLITKDLMGAHAGRLKLKYGPSNTFDDGATVFSNYDFYELVKQQLKLADDACWFVSNISIRAQDELILRAFIVNPNGPESYKDSKALHAAWDVLDASGETRAEDNYRTGYISSFPRNRIVFGAPGTGKSFTLNEDKEKLIGRNNEADYERVTFHPDYSYANFVGTYKPVPCKDEDGKESITYEYVPGPFMRILVKALKNSMADNPKPFLLLIEEINRANVAAVFGDVFQLLDRDKDGVSEYPIQTSEDMRNYFVSELGGDASNYERLCLPDNLYIWATMNSADQGVFPMDTAFKRRWDFTYIGIDDNDQDIQGKMVVLGSKKKQKVEWNRLRKAINKFLADKGINEDKQLGPYFISRQIVVPESGSEIDSAAFIDVFKNKVIMYLFEDAAKQKRTTLFEGCSEHNSRYSEICKEFDDNGIEIFHYEIGLNTNPIAVETTVNG